MNKKKIAYIINHTTFFSSHILPHATFAKRNGFVIKLFCGKYSSKSMNIHGIELLKKNKIDFEIFNFNSTSLNFLKEFFIFCKLFIQVKKFKPDLIHVATPKGQIYGGLVAKLLNIKSLVIFISGMGYLYSNKLNVYEKLAKIFFQVIQKFIFKHKNKKIIVENKDDFSLIKKNFKIDNKQIIIINGSGVNLKIFKKIKNRSINKVILFAGRILKEKGIIEFAKAAMILKKKFPNWRFIAAGAIDYNKKSSLNTSFIEFYKKKNFLEFVNYKKNIFKLYKLSSIVCLPSYREGLPKSLCEAAACGLPIVTCNVVGCRSAIIPKITGELCSPYNVNSLVKKLEILIKNKKLRIFYGNNGLRLAKNKFDVKIISSQILKIYKNLLNEI